MVYLTQEWTVYSLQVEIRVKGRVQGVSTSDSVPPHSPQTRPISTALSRKAASVQRASAITGEHCGMSTGVVVRVESTMLMMAAGARRAVHTPVMSILHPSTHADDELHALCTLHRRTRQEPTMGHNVLWRVCAEGAGTINDLCFLHERCSYRLSAGVLQLVWASLDWECVELCF